MRTVFLILLTFSGQLLADELAERAWNKCVACHTLEEGKHGAGPGLHKLAGRKAGSVEGFKFSKAFRKSEITWNAETLDAYLKNPISMCPATAWHSQD